MQKGQQTFTSVGLIGAIQFHPRKASVGTVASLTLPTVLPLR